MRGFFVLVLFFSFSFGDDFKKQNRAFEEMNREFAAFQKSEEAAFEEYTKRVEAAFDDYKNEIKEFWKTPDLSTKKEWVHYANDKRSRSKVDFEKKKITIEVIAKDEKEAKKEMQTQLEYVASKNTKEVIESDELQKRVAKISAQEEKKELDIAAEPILQNVMFEKKPSKKELEKYTKKSINESKITQSSSKLQDLIVYKVSIDLPSDTTLKRSRVYKADVIQNAKRFDVPAPLIFAVMQTESDFNPFAKSHIPAYGLMQIVPHSAGRDTYRFLYKRDGEPTATYLYNGKKNIVMGSSYLHILYYRYLKDIKNPQSRLYCAIAAYNTGAGNIAWAFTKTHNMKRAAPLINAMTPNEVYNHLQKNLRYDEPKHYLKRVRKRMPLYKNAYKL